MEALNMPPYFDNDYVTHGELELRYEFLDQKIEATNKRIDGILEAVAEVKCLQEKIYSTLLYVGAATILVLVGVIVGKGIDLVGLIT